MVKEDISYLNTKLNQAKSFLNSFKDNIDESMSKLKISNNEKNTSTNNNNIDDYASLDRVNSSRNTVTLIEQNSHSKEKINKIGNKLTSTGSLSNIKANVNANYLTKSKEIESKRISTSGKNIVKLTKSSSSNKELESILSNQYKTNPSSNKALNTTNIIKMMTSSRDIHIESPNVNSITVDNLNSYLKPIVQDYQVSMEEFEKMINNDGSNTENILQKFKSLKNKIKRVVDEYNINTDKIRYNNLLAKEMNDYYQEKIKEFHEEDKKDRFCLHCHKTFLISNNEDVSYVN